MVAHGGARKKMSWSLCLFASADQCCALSRLPGVVSNLRSIEPSRQHCLVDSEPGMPRPGHCPNSMDSAVCAPGSVIVLDRTSPLVLEDPHYIRTRSRKLQSNILPPDAKATHGWKSMVCSVYSTLTLFSKLGEPFKSRSPRPEAARQAARTSPINT